MLMLNYDSWINEVLESFKKFCRSDITQLKFTNECKHVWTRL